MTYSDCKYGAKAQADTKTVIQANLHSIQANRGTISDICEHISFVAVWGDPLECSQFNFS